MYANEHTFNEGNASFAYLDVQFQKENQTIA